MTSGIGLLREILNSCTESERKIDEYILANPREAVVYTIAELSKKAGTNPPAAIRLCKKAGLSGYRELQILLTRDIYSANAYSSGPLPPFTLSSQQTVDSIAKNIVTSTNDALDRVLTLINTHIISSVADSILTARSVALFGSGASANVAYDFYQKLSRIGIPCSFAFDSDIQINTACSMTPYDLAIIVSYSGKTLHSVLISEEAKRSGAKLVAMTSVGQSPISKLADVVLNVPVTEPLLRTGASLSRTTQLILVDILYATIISQSIDVSIPRLERSRKAVQSLYSKKDDDGDSI